MADSQRGAVFLIKESEPMTEVETYDFSTESNQQAVKIDGNEYTMKGADSDSTCKWNNRMISNAVLDHKGRPKSINKVADQEPYLVSLCLFDDRTKKRVPEAVVRSWPDKLVKSLCKLARTLSELDDDENADPLPGKLRAALEMPGAPCAWYQLVAWIESIEEDDDDFNDLTTWLTPEDSTAKNVQSGTTAT